MSRELLILRHAKSDWETDAPSDFQRPLAKRGRKDAPRMGKWLREQGITPDHVLSSPALRARQTVEHVCDELGLDRKTIEWDENVYLAELNTLLEVIANCPTSARRVLLVGHNPGLEDLLEYLCRDATSLPSDGKVLPTATVARVELPDKWKRLVPGSGKLVSLTRPRELKASGKRT